MSQLRRFSQSRLLPRFMRRGAQKGVALIIVLGIVALLLILVMAFAFDAQTTSQTASVMNDAVRVDLMARGGLERVMGFLGNEMGTSIPERLNPGILFYEPPTDANQWHGRRQLPFYSDTNVHDTGIVSALNVTFQSGAGTNTVYFTPTVDKLINGQSFYEVLISRDRTISDTTVSISGDLSSQDSEIVGRVTYMIMDLTGGFDPAVVMNSDSNETQSATHVNIVADGSNINQLQLADFYTSASGTFIQNMHFNDNSPAGELAAGTRWNSYQTIARSASPTQAEFDSVAALSFPIATYEKEEYWGGDLGSGAAPYNDSSPLGTNELRDRIALDELGISYDTEALYDKLIGYHASANANRDVTSEFSPWLAASGYGADVDSAQVAAARLACYMADYVDTDNHITYATINQTTGEITTSASIPGAGFSGTGGQRTVYGLESGLYLSEVEAELAVVFNANGGVFTATPTFRVELYDPWDDVSPTNVNITVDYTFSVGDDLGTNLTSTSSVTFVGGDFPSSTTTGIGAANSSATNGRVRAASKAGGTQAGTSTALSASWALNSFQITKIVVEYTNASGTFVTGNFPAHRNAVRSYWIRWQDPALTARLVSDTLYAYLTAKDPLMSAVDGEDIDFTSYWTCRDSTGENNLAMIAVAPASLALGTSGPETLGYNTKAYGDLIAPADAPFERVGQLGGLHDPIRLDRSVRLWAANAAAMTNHDAYLLDMFYIKADRPKQAGRININSTNDRILTGLFTGINSGGAAPTALPAARAAEVASDLMSYNGATSGAPFTYRGDVYRGWETAAASLGYTNVHDDIMEGYVQSVVELISTRYNQYMVVVDAQALKDVGVIPDSAAGQDAALIKWKDGGAANTHSWCRPVAEQKILAYLRRDAYTNDIKILRLEVVE